jgi:hypothetical protein
MNTAAYCKAKQRLCLEKLKELAKITGKEIDKKAEKWKWKNRDVYLADGTVINLEDTDEINKKFPKAFSKGKQQGQPKLRMLGLFSLASGAFLDAEIARYSGKGQSETTLMQRLIKRIKPGSVLVLDRFFTSFFLQNMFLKSQIDYVIRARDKFAKKNLGRKKDKIINLPNPGGSNYPSYNTKNAPQSIKVRLIKSSIKRKGFRTATLFILTSLLDHKKYSKEDLEQLYLERWGVELDIRHLKTTLEADLLRSKTAEMSQKELWVHLLGFNLIRNINVAVANHFNEQSPRKRSFKTTLSVYLEGIKSFGSKAGGIIIELLKNEILNFKYRREPRALKRRNNRFPLLTKSRKESKKENWGYSRRKGQMGLSVTGEA